MVSDNDKTHFYSVFYELTYKYNAMKTALKKGIYDDKTRYQKMMINTSIDNLDFYLAKLKFWAKQNNIQI